MDLIILLGLVFLAALLLSYGWIKLATGRHWFDIPNQRSSHRQPTPRGGGVAFVLVFMSCALLLQRGGYVPAHTLLLCLPGLALAATGLVDDMKQLGIGLRLGLQALCALAGTLLLPGLPPLPFPGFALVNEAILLVAILLSWMWLVNLYNFMDGIDALAASEAIFVALALSWFCVHGGAGGLGLLLLLLAVAVAGFLYFNLPTARLFMGDSGSNFLGYILGALGLLAAWYQLVSIWTLLILLGVFIVDSTLTLLKRMRAGLVWYHGHRSHAYQQAARRFGAHGKVVLGVCLVNICWLLPLAWLSTLWVRYGLLLTLIAWLPLILIVAAHRIGEEGRVAGQAS